MPCKNVTPHAPNVRLRTKRTAARGHTLHTDCSLSPCFAQSIRAFVWIGIAIASLARLADLIE